jgi:hypothetical protein
VILMNVKMSYEINDYIHESAIAIFKLFIPKNEMNRIFFELVIGPFFTIERLFD